MHNIGGFLFATPEPLEPLRLGEYYKLRVPKLNEKRGELFAKIRNDLIQYQDEELLDNFSSTGIPTAEWSKQWVSNYQAEVKAAFSSASKWHRIELFRTKELADFKHWGRSEFLSVNEVVWLSVGLEPKEEFVKAAMPSKRTKLDGKFDEVIEYMTRHREIIRRKFDPNSFGDHPDFKGLQEWIDEVQLEVHPGFANMLAARHKRKHTNKITGRTDRSLEPMDGRERASMVKLITAMAIDAYGYDPKSRRSAIPNEIQGIADRLGLEITSETIRKYLKVGAEALPEDWKPE
ncbi:hypothetical protein [Sulfitobacter pacificus]|nr:hypothetical protein [Sulfitobacter pacificus]